MRLLLLLLMLSLACNAPTTTTPPTTKVAPHTEPPLQVGLSDGRPIPETIDKSTIEQGRPLTDEEFSKLSKVFTEPLPVQTQPVAFLKRSVSKPPPRAAKKTSMAFPAKSPAPKKPKPKASQLQVVSVAPQGPVEHSSRVSISFNSSMVALSDSALPEEAEPLGITLTPRPKGRWRWLGTQTLIFEPKGGHIPAGTEYKVTVPKGVKDVNGIALAQARTQTFSLPRPAVTSSSPTRSGVVLEPLITLTFNQPVDPTILSEKIRLQGEGQEVSLKPLSLEQAKKLVGHSLTNKPDNTVLFFQPCAPLRPGSGYSLVVDPGIVSLEGPLTGSKRWKSYFSTFAPLKLKERFPRRHTKVDPSEAFTLLFNNNLDSEAFSQDWVTVEPPLADMKCRVVDNSLSISGLKEGRTDYKVTISGHLKDRFKQTLGTPLSLVMATKAASPTLEHGLDSFTVLDANKKAVLPVSTTNVERLELVVHRVTPDDWNHYLRYLQNRWTREQVAPPGTPLQTKVLVVEADTDKLTTTQIDLSAYFQDGEGNLIVTVRDPQERSWRYPQRKFTTWIQRTKVGIDLEVSNESLVALVTQLEDGRPIPGAKIKLGGQRSTTDDSGTAALPLPNQKAPYCLVESTIGSCFLPCSTSYYWAGQGWERSQLEPAITWSLFDDRGLYKPGETANIKGCVRGWKRGADGGLFIPGKTGEELTWTLYDPRNTKLHGGKTRLSRSGAVDLTVRFPKTTNLGHHRIVIRGKSLPEGTHYLNVQEFRRPEFEVTTKCVSQQPHLLLDSATVSADATYYSGGPLAGATVNWSVSALKASYKPPSHSQYNFGRWTPWWELGRSYWWWEPTNEEEIFNQEKQGTTDSGGSHQLKIDLQQLTLPFPTSVTATARVVDINRQQQSDSTTLLVHPSRRYVGLRAKKSFVDQGHDFKLDAVVTDIDGQTLVGVPITLTLLALDYDSNYREVETTVSQQQAISAETPLKLTLPVETGGRYKVRAEVLDDSGRLNRTEYQFWKAGSTLSGSDTVELESLTIVPSSKEYKPGDTARILVMAPFPEGTGLVVWSRDGIVDYDRFTIRNGTAIVERTVTEELIPNLHASLTVVGKKADRPAVASATVDLGVSTASRELTIELQPSKQETAPGETVSIKVNVNDHKGQPVPEAEVTLWVVDEALLGLTGYKTPSPMEVFYQHRPKGLSDYHLRTALRMKKRETPYTANYPQYSGIVGLIERGGPGDYAPSAPKIRKDFSAQALFKGKLITDKAGHTTVEIKLPDNLTRYRVMAVAIHGQDRFGTEEQTLKTRLPLMVRPSLPRFLNFGDKASLPVVVQNQTDQAITVQVIGEATGAKWVGPRGRELRIPARARREVRFQAQADQVGQAYFRFAALSNQNSDAAIVELPVYTPASGEAFATYGSLADDEVVSQPVLRPKGVWSQFGGLEISLSSTAMSELSDAFLYLYNYRFECAEQRASRMLGVASMGEFLAAFNSKDMPSKADRATRMAADILHLTRLQNYDGGWQFWRREQKSDPFVSVHVAHALARAKKAKFPVNKATLNSALEYLRDIEVHCQQKSYGSHGTRALAAYALYVRDLLGDTDPKGARSLFRQLAQAKDLNLEALGWLWPTLAKHARGSNELQELRRLVKNRVTQTANKAQFATSYGESDKPHLILHSSRRVDALLLCGLLIDQPQDPLNAKLVRGLLAGRVKGRWNNTQENIWVLLALQSYFQIYEKQTPNFVSQLWLGEDYLGQESFKGRSASEAQLEIPMGKVPEEQAPLLIGKSGEGRLYYRVGMSYASKDLKLPQESRGFTVERTFRGLDKDSDVRRTEEGDWVVKAGSRVEVTLTMVCPERRTHVALVDQLPAGLEPLNLSLKSPEKARWWRWYEHDNLRDERVEAFSRQLHPGVYAYTYTALASTPGDYVLPPAKAEEMYSPEVFGRTTAGRLKVL